MPDVPCGDLVVHPSNENHLYLGTQLGSFRTTNGGTAWHRWNNGLPEAVIVTEMSSIDSTAINGKFYVVAGTYGRGIWKREISGDDPTAVGPQVELPEAPVLYQNHPNPFNPVTTIRFVLPERDRVELVVYDLGGRAVATLVNGVVEWGSHDVRFDGRELASGAYVCALRTSRGVSARKLLLVR